VHTLAASILALAAAAPHAAGASRFGIYALERDAPASAATRAVLARRHPRARLVYCASSVCGRSRWYALVRGPEIDGSQVVRSSVRVQRDPATGQPIVVFRFTPGGQQAFHSVTGLVARRGRRTGRPEHVAFVLGARVLSAPFVDYRRDPNGLVGGSGVEIAAPSQPSARRIARALRAEAAA
jgi:preprotein translocase subunit SecD